MLKSRDHHCQGGEKYGVCSYSEMQRGLQKQQEEQGNAPAQYSGKIDKIGRFELVFTVFCG